MKYEWRKKEKGLYLSKTTPELIDVPVFNFFSIKGEGNPNSSKFSEYIGALYSLSYAIRMSSKAELEPQGFYEYTVYPLEGVWDISDKAKKIYNGTLDKDTLVYNLMIRQPEFVTEEYALETIERTMKKKPNELLKQVKFSSREEGKCVQMLHLGSYDNESETFEIMEAFCEKNNLQRQSKIHREIYLSDPRKVAPEKLKTVLRFNVK
jgi:hypothetical protein